MRILVACEYSGRVREAFRKLGHDAWSCDLLPSDDDSPYHITGDVLPLLKQKWDMMIAHPPCTYLTNSGVRWLYTKPDRWKDLIEGAVFFRTLLTADIPLIAVENPIMHKYAQAIVGQKQTQVIQPWMFGHMEMKGTALWLKGLPPLKPTNDVKEEMMKLPYGERAKVHHASPGPDRWKLRSYTYQGIADAMAEQWGNQGGKMNHLKDDLIKLKYGDPVKTPELRNVPDPDIDKIMSYVTVNRHEFTDFGVCSRCGDDFIDVEGVECYA